MLHTRRRCPYIAVGHGSSSRKAGGRSVTIDSALVTSGSSVRPRARLSQVERGSRCHPDHPVSLSGDDQPSLAWGRATIYAGSFVMGSGFRILEQRRRGGERLWPSHPETWRNRMCNVIDKHTRELAVHVNRFGSSLGGCDVKTAISHHVCLLL